MDGIPFPPQPTLRAESWSVACPSSGSFRSFLRWWISPDTDNVSLEELEVGGGSGGSGGGGGGGGGGAVQRGVDVRAGRGGGDIGGLPG